MKLTIKRGGGLPYARKDDYEYDGTQYEADLQNGDTVTILDGGETEQGNYGEQIVFVVKTRNGDKKFTMNQTTVNVLIEEFGDDTETWVGKEVKVLTQKKVIAGKKCVVAYLATDAWSMDDYGELTKTAVAQTPLHNAEAPAPTKPPVDTTLNPPVPEDM